MKKIDYLILGELLLDPQAPFLQIGKKLKISSFTVKYRYDSMVKEGIIRKPMINLDLSKLGYQGKIFLLITNVQNEPKEKTIDALKKLRNVILISEIIGPCDMIAIAPSTDFNSITELVNQVKGIPSVEQVNITCISGTSLPFDRSYRKTTSQISFKTAANYCSSVAKEKAINAK